MEGKDDSYGQIHFVEAAVDLKPIDDKQQFQGIRKLAERLGVKSLEVDPDQSRDILVKIWSGEKYESWSGLAIVNAVLDRLDAK